MDGKLKHFSQTFPDENAQTGVIRKSETIIS